MRWWHNEITACAAGLVNLTRGDALLSLSIIHPAMVINSLTHFRREDHAIND